ATGYAGTTRPSTVDSGQSGELLAQRAGDGQPGLVQPRRRGRCAAAGHPVRLGDARDDEAGGQGPGAGRPYVGGVDSPAGAGPGVEDADRVAFRVVDVGPGRARRGLDLGARHETGAYVGPARHTGAMCGRYVNVASNADLTEEFDAEEVVGDDPGPSWNVAPTDPVRVVVERPPREAESPAATVRQIRTVNWGLVPNWSKDAKGGARMINAR